MTENQPVIIPDIVKGRETEKALMNLAENDPDKARTIISFINALTREDHRLLREGEMFAVKTPDGTSVCEKRHLTLHVGEGTLVPLGNKDNSPVSATAAGYKKVAAAASVNVMNAKSLSVDGKEKQNPYVVRNKMGDVVAVYARAIAFGYTSTGYPAISDRTAIFDLKQYRLVELLAKVKYNPDNFKLLPVETEPEVDPEKKPVPTWAKYPFDEFTNIWVNTSHKEAISFYTAFTNKLKKATEYAQTFAARNAIKHHPAIPNIKVQNGQTSVGVEVIGWRPVQGNFSWNLGAYSDLIENVGDLSMLEHDKVSEEPKPIVNTGSDVVDDETIEVAMDEEDREEDKQSQDSDGDGQPSGETVRVETGIPPFVPDEETKGIIHDGGWVEEDGVIDEDVIQGFNLETKNDAETLEKKAEQNEERTEQSFENMKDWFVAYDSEVMNRLKSAQGAVPDEFNKAVETLGVSSLLYGGNLTDETAEKIMLEINRLVDGGE